MRLQKIVWTQILRDGHKNSLKNRLFCVVKQVYSEDLIRPTYFINYLFPDIKHIVNIHHTFTVCKDMCRYGAKKHEHLQHDLVRTTPMKRDSFFVVKGKMNWIFKNNNSICFNFTYNCSTPSVLFSTALHENQTREFCLEVNAEKW